MHGGRSKPHVEKSGLEWRGRYQWDWHADVGFATGYTPKERERLVDTYMEDFKSIFGYFPKSVGSWFIDAHSLGYMSDKYGITASCNCKDQIGTDGYTLWGGYWNQAYYPSRKNAYMPAQNEKNQIPVPVFRMLGSDPIHQYDNGLGGNVQRVVSLEPVYKGGGGNEEWCTWYFDNFVNGECLAYAYVQTGQENSFTWQRMKQGFEIQFPIIDSLRKEGKLVVQKLQESGEWFIENFETTPATSVTVLSDHSDKDFRTVWFNSRFYRANMLWEKGTLRFRDIHLFDENVESDYLLEKGTSTKCDYYTLPVMDGFQWSSEDYIAGIRLMRMENGEKSNISGKDPVVSKDPEGKLLITWPLNEGNSVIRMTFSESLIEISSSGNLKDWLLEFSWAEGKEIPLTSVEKNRMEFEYKGNKYSVEAGRGKVQQESDQKLTITPEKRKIEILLTNN